MKLSPFLERRYRALLIVTAAEKPVAEIKLPGVRIKGTTNGSQGVTLGGRRFRRGKQAGLRALGHNAALTLNLWDHLGRHGAIVVRIVRVAPHRLDGDNLEAAFKRVRDGVARCLEVDDRHQSVEYVIDDERGAVREYAVRFEVFPGEIIRERDREISTNFIHADRRIDHFPALPDFSHAKALAERVGEHMHRAPRPKSKPNGVRLEVEPVVGHGGRDRAHVGESQRDVPLPTHPRGPTPNVRKPVSP